MSCIPDTRTDVLTFLCLLPRIAFNVTYTSINVDIILIEFESRYGSDIVDELDKHSRAALKTRKCESEEI